MPKCLLHLDIDAFFASVETLRNPRLRGRPVIVGAGVIASCSYEARRFGLKAGMGLRKAKTLCPQVVILDGNQPVYRAFAGKVWAICRAFTPNMETLLDDAYLDLAGTERLHGPVEPMARNLKRRIHLETGLNVTVGVANCRTVARMASACGKPDGLIVVAPGAEGEFISGLPVERLPGVGHHTAELLCRMNVTTIGTLAELPAWSLETLFGVRGLALHERAQGRDSRVVDEREIPKSISRETSFHENTTDLREIEGMLYYLTERAAKPLRELGLVAKTVTVKIRYSDFEGDAASRSLPERTALDGDLFEVARAILHRLYGRRVSLHNIGVTLSNFRMDGDAQPGLFDERNLNRVKELYRVLDDVRDRFGHGSIVAGRSLDLLDRLPKSDYGFVLRTPSLTK